MVWSGVQLVLPATQEMHESSWEPPSYPPQATSLPPDRRERLWLDLGWGRSGMKQESERGRGNSSTLERPLVLPLPLLSEPPTTTWPDEGVFYWHHHNCRQNNQYGYFDICLNFQRYLGRQFDNYNTALKIWENCAWRFSANIFLIHCPKQTIFTFILHTMCFCEMKNIKFAQIKTVRSESHSSMLIIVFGS